MKKVYIIQMNTNTIPSRIISLFTGYKYSHVAISFNRNCDITYSFGRKKIYTIINGGFVSPRDFDNITGFNLIYTGKYALYR